MSKGGRRRRNPATPVVTRKRGLRRSYRLLQRARERHPLYPRWLPGLPPMSRVSHRYVGGATASRRTDPARTPLPRNGYVRSHTLSSTLTPNIFKPLPRVAPFFSSRRARRLGLSAVSADPRRRVYTAPRGPRHPFSCSSIFPEKAHTKMYHCARPTLAQRCSAATRRATALNIREGNGDKGGFREGCVLGTNDFRSSLDRAKGNELKYFLRCIL